MSNGKMIYALVGCCLFIILHIPQFYGSPCNRDCAGDMETEDSGHGDMEAALPKHVSDKLLARLNVPLISSLENHFGKISGYGDRAAALPKPVSDKLLQWRKVPLNPSLENHFREISGYGDMAAALPKDVSDKLLAWLRVQLENRFGKRMSDTISSPGFNDDVNDYCDFALGQVVDVIPQLKAVMLIPGARSQQLNFMKFMVKKALVLLLVASDEQNKEANSFVDMYVSDTVERKRKRNGELAA